jgi:hypothetical protein
VAEHPDIVVRFEETGGKLVFWRGISYIPCWVTENDIWYTNEFCETIDENTTSSQEPLSDRYCLFSHVRVIENHPARTVIHWRYALSDYEDKLAHKDPQTGWHDMADEYYYVYPNAVAMRKIILYSSRLDLWHEFQESIVINPPGVMPDDQIESEAVTLANLKGESKTFYWKNTPEAKWLPQPLDKPKDACIEVINLKSTFKPFLIAPPEKTRIDLLRDGGLGESRFYTWRGPVRKLEPKRPTPAKAESYDQTTHTCLSNFFRTDHPSDTFGWQPYEQTEQSLTKLMINGITTKSASELAFLGRSWLRPPNLELLGDSSFTNEGYDPTQLAYVLSRQTTGKSSVLKLKISCSIDSPLCRPTFVIKNCRESNVVVKVNGKTIPSDNFRFGFSRRLEGTDLIIWLRKETTQSIQIEILLI